MKKTNKKSIFFSVVLLFLSVLGIIGVGSTMTAEAKEVSLVTGASVQYMGYSTHYYYVDGNMAYCLEPGKLSPNNGTYSSDELDKDQLLAKAMYYVYGGPGYDVYMKPTLTGGWDQPDRAYCLSHCILSYIYDGCDPNSDGFKGLNADISNAVIQYTNAIQGWPNIPDTDIALSQENLTAFFSAEEGVQRTEVVTCEGDTSNSLVLSLPEGVTLVNVTQQSRLQGLVTVHGQEQFYLASDVAYGNGTSWDSGQIKGTMNQAWRTLVVKTGGGSQDIGTGQLLTVEPSAVSLQVKWMERPELMVEKHADKTGKTYQLGDIVTYTMDVTQQIQNAVAKNVVITDTILTEGVQLQKNSIVLLDGSRNVIQDAVISVNGNSFTIHAGEFLQCVELGERYIVEYQMAITDESVIGKEIDNEVVVCADNAEEKKDEEKILVEKPKESDEPEKETPEIEKPETEPEKLVEAKSKTTAKIASVKTGDQENIVVLVLFLILSCTTIFVCVKMNAWLRKIWRK